MFENKESNISNVYSIEEGNIELDRKDSEFPTKEHIIYMAIFLIVSMTLIGILFTAYNTTYNVEQPTINPAQISSTSVRNLSPPTPPQILDKFGFRFVATPGSSTPHSYGNNIGGAAYFDSAKDTGIVNGTTQSGFLNSIVNHTIYLQNDKGNPPAPVTLQEFFNYIKNGTTPSGGHFFVDLNNNKVEDIGETVTNAQTMMVSELTAGFGANNQLSSLNYSVDPRNVVVNLKNGHAISGDKVASLNEDQLSGSTFSVYKTNSDAQSAVSSINSGNTAGIPTSVFDINGDAAKTQLVQTFSTKTQEVLATQQGSSYLHALQRYRNDILTRTDDVSGKYAENLINNLNKAPDGAIKSANYQSGLKNTIGENIKQVIPGVGTPLKSKDAEIYAHATVDREANKSYLNTEIQREGVRLDTISSQLEGMKNDQDILTVQKLIEQQKQTLELAQVREPIDVASYNANNLRIAEAIKDYNFKNSHITGGAVFTNNIRESEAAKTIDTYINNINRQEGIINKITNGFSESERVLLENTSRNAGNYYREQNQRSETVSQTYIDSNRIASYQNEALGHLRLSPNGTQQVLDNINDSNSRFRNTGASNNPSSLSQKQQYT